VLFLDEVGELTPAIQAKLLRVMETGEVTALGATSAQKTQVRFCLASPLHLRAEAAAGRFRQDLLYRVHTHVVVPPLRERREEIAYLVAWELARAGSLRAHSRFIEACLLRPWPGNVRELLSEVRAAADAARAVGTDVVRLEHLAAEGGAGMSTGAPLTRESIQHALAHASGNISEAARVLGLHRTQLRRTMDKLGIAAKSDS
jgi:DNA-binding NtrC family response regulator